MIKVALIGLGTMGQQHIDAWKQVKGAELVAISGQNVEKAERIGKELGVPVYFGLDEMIAGTDFDMLDICLPTYMHKEIVIKAAKAGKHIICEKPLALDAEEGDEMKRVCEENNVSLYPAHTLRFLPDYVNAYNMIKNNELGKLGVIRMQRCASFPKGWDNWFADDARSGGVALDLLIHDLDWLRWTCGEAVKVTALRDKRVVDGDERDHILIVLKMENGVIAHVEGSWSHTAFFSSFEITGDKGMLTHDSRETWSMPMQLHETEKKERGVEVPQKQVKRSPYLTQMQHFIDCHVNGAEPRVTVEDGIKSVALCRAAIRSAELKRPLTSTNGGDWQ